MPKISVLMGVYNCAKYVEEAIESILNQTYTDFECVICDDGSKDETPNIVRKLAEKDSRIVFVENDRNHGLAYTLNHALEHVTGEYVVRMDGDDISLPNRFERLLAEIEAHPEYSVIGSGVDLFDGNGVWGELMQNVEPTIMDAYLNNTVSHATTIMRTADLKDVGAYNPDTDSARAEDYDLWCRFVEKGYRLKTLQEKLYQVRWDQGDYYSRRPFKTKLAYARLVRYWHKRFHLGSKGINRIVISYLKVIIPSWVKNLYHKLHYGK